MKIPKFQKFCILIYSGFVKDRSNFYRKMRTDEDLSRPLEVMRIFIQKQPDRKQTSLLTIWLFFLLTLPPNESKPFLAAG